MFRMCIACSIIEEMTKDQKNAHSTLLGHSTVRTWVPGGADYMTSHLAHLVAVARAGCIILDFFLLQLWEGARTVPNGHRTSTRYVIHDFYIM